MSGFGLDFVWDPSGRMIQYRWGIDQKCTVSAVKDHFFFGQKAGRRSLTRNALSRLWWIGRLTYDEKEKTLGN